MISQAPFLKSFRSERAESIFQGRDHTDFYTPLSDSDNENAQQSCIGNFKRMLCDYDSAPE